MGRFLLEKLIVISDGEQKSKEVFFEKGLNIILGENKTGKSSLLKSIFYTLGCELKIEADWKKLIDWYLLYFFYNDKRYCIIRQGKNFKVIHLNENTQNELLIDTEHFHEFGGCLMNVLGASVECLTNEGEIVPITPPLLFRFQYIDQDNGWNRIGEAFTNMKYILNWKDYTSKYVVGFQGEEFYRTKKDISLIKKKIESLQTKEKHFIELITYLMGSNSEETNDRTNPDFVTILEITEVFLNDLNELEKKRIILKEKTSTLKNERYEKILALDLLKKSVEALNHDHDFALEQGDSLKCPFCGAEHKNSIKERVEIVKDIQEGGELIRIYRDDINELEEQIISLEKRYKDANKKYITLKKRLEATEKGASIVKTYKNEGKKEIVETSNEKKDEVRALINKEEVLKVEKEEFLKTLNQEEKRKQIYSDLKEQYQIVLNKLNIPVTYMQFNNFVQVLSKTGSELPRIIYAYHIALYLYNLSRKEGLFSWLVVDTPNQQGQDKENLTNIDSVLELVMSKEGQFIIGTERETGYEGQAENVIKLTDYKSCLIKDNYLKHKDIVNKLYDLSKKNKKQL